MGKFVGAFAPTFGPPPGACAPGSPTVVVGAAVDVVDGALRHGLMISGGMGAPGGSEAIRFR
ncbi:hypothetical protein R3Q08_30915 [Rhodococcus erythropolis]|uniref:hypothetical protein n=1 Tax=Rhodococcus erythropolis TaxID=1833 RepID=UPI00294A390F|nr:hypothetical protein [Rhodococcus erythropolis]MDV6212676.1 hypothetical protein [Rhodococcus erythropolis]